MITNNSKINDVPITIQLVVCFLERCTQLSNPNSGNVTMVTDGQKTTATYVCSEGYTIQGMQQQSLIITCQEDGQWSLTDTPECGRAYFSLCWHAHYSKHQFVHSYTTITSIIFLHITHV